MSDKRDLTRIGPRVESGLESLLAEVGLELWQAPEGFWAVRVKPAAARTPGARPRQPRLRGAR